MALTIQIYLKIQRLDLAKAELEQMQSKDDDSALTQLATAWVYLGMGGEKYQEAAYIYQEQADKSGANVTLLNGLAAANIRLQRYDEALRNLQKAVKMEGGLDDLPSTASSNEVLVNLLVCATHLRKKSLVEDCLRRLKQRTSAGQPFSDNLEALKNAGLE